MSDYIKLFSTESERTAYESGEDFQVPYVSLSDDTKKVNYLSKFLKPIDLAEVGDIVLDGKIMCVSPSNYSKVEGFKNPIGVVGIKKGLLPDGMGRIVSLDFMSVNTPATGSKTGEQMYWGASGNILGLNYLKQYPCIDNNGTLTTSIQTVKNQGYIPSTQFNQKSSLTPGYSYYSTSASGYYIPCPFLEDGTLDPNFIATSAILPGTSTVTTITNPLGDFDGKSNTQKIMDQCTAQTLVNSYQTGNYPAAHACTLYNVGNLNWYLPSVGEIALTGANQAVINSSRILLGEKTLASNGYWSSTPSDSSYVNCLHFNALSSSSNVSRSASPSPAVFVLAMSTF